MKSDARVRYTRKMIRDTFIELLGHKPISKITVTQICEGAQINRATFYKYYQDVYDLQEKIEEEYYEEFKASIGTMERDGMHETLVKVLTTFRDHFHEYLAITGNGQNSSFAQKAMRGCYEMFAPKITYPKFGRGGESFKKMFYSYISAGSTGVLNYWCYTGMKDSPEDVATMIEDLIHATIHGMSK